jgi:DNA primase
MNSNEIKESLTEEQIIKLLISLGSDDPKFDKDKNLIFKTICHHGDSHKLYYYQDSKMFKCYTDCSDSFDIFELVQRNKNYNFVQSINYICNLLNIQKQRKKGFTTSSKYLIDDWDLIDKYTKNKYIPTNIMSTTVIDNNILGLFKNYYHQSWIDDGISIEAMKKYQIKFDIVRNKIIIPHFDINGQLIGIRGRSLNQDEIEDGKKYMPLYIEKEEYRHPLGQNLYGFDHTKETIRRIGKIALFEAEKSVLQCETFYGKDNFTVATCGSNITNFQRNMVLNSGAREVFICNDKQFQEKESEEAYKYADKLKYLASKFSSYITTYVVWDNDGLLGYKESPSDRGRIVLEQLMKKKFEIQSNGEEAD